MSVPASSEHLPLVSIGLPVFNGARFIQRALNVLAMQTFMDYELIVVDNGSTDATGAICRAHAEQDPRIRYIRYEGTIPIVDNFWRTFLHARGTYFLWNAADDERPPETLEHAVAALTADPAAVMVHGPVDLEVVREKATRRIHNDMNLSVESAAARVAAYTSGLRHNGMLYGVYRREALARVRFRQHAGQDFLVGVQMALTGRILYTDQPLIRYRHVYGPVDDPIYQLTPPSLKDLLGYWGHKRHKAWTVWARGTVYLLCVRNTPLRERVSAAVAYVRSYGRRYWRHLTAESVFALTLPFAWLARPLVRARLRLRQRNQAGVSIG